MPWAEVNGTSLRYVIEGDRGAHILLLHEAGGCIESYDEVAEALADSFRVVRYDQRGFGHSEPSYSFDLASSVADLAALIDYLDLPGEVHLVGCAFGGDVAASYCRQRSDRVTSLVISSPRSEPMDAARGARLAELATKIAAQGMRGIRDDYLAGLYPESLREIAPARFEQYRARWVCNDAKAYARLIPTINEIDAAAVYPHIACPTLVLAGTLDTSRPVAMARAVADMVPDGHLEVLETGHFMAVQSPELFIRAVRQFISKVDLAARLIQSHAESLK
jgi:3-oxoadipate enol-lactonase